MKLLPPPGMTSLLCALLATTGSAWGHSNTERVRPPLTLACPRDQLTLYGGEVQRYQRRKGQTQIRINTDWGTTEMVTLRHAGSRDPSAWFLLQGQAFTPEDWPRIESAPGRLRPRVRVAAWMCDDGRNATVDWQPPPSP